MASPRFLDMQYAFSKRDFVRKPSKLFSKRSRSSSNSPLPIFFPDLQELRQVFDKFDSNKDGKISPEEYESTLKAIVGTRGTDSPFAAEVKGIFEVVDLDGDGFVDFEEFVEAQKKGGGVRTADLHGAFRAFDRDGDGKITAEEIYEVMMRLGEGCSLRDCRKMVRAVDVNGDGAVDSDEFITMRTRTMGVAYY